MVIGIASQLGCAGWYNNAFTEKPREEKITATKAIPAGNLSIQTILLRLNTEDSQVLEQLWPNLDEVSFDYPLRQKLELNGIRCGTIIGEIPGDIQRWIDVAAERIQNDPLENLGINAEIQSYSQVYISRDGTEKNIYVKPMRPENLVIMHNENGSGSGKTFADPALLLRLVGRQQDNGAIRLNVEPAVEHGQFKNLIVGEDFAMRRETKRDVHLWPDLKITRDLSDGQILVLSCTQPPRALGQHFFTTKLRDQSDARLVMLIRVNKSQSDSAFVKK